METFFMGLLSLLSIEMGYLGVFAWLSVHN